MDVRLVTKQVARAIVGTSASFTVGRVLMANTPVEKKHEVAERYIGSFVIGAMTAEVARTWTDKKVDAIFDWADTLPFKKTDPEL